MTDQEGIDIYVKGFTDGDAGEYLSSEYNKEESKWYAFGNYDHFCGDILNENLANRNELIRRIKDTNWKDG